MNTYEKLNLCEDYIYVNLALVLCFKKKNDFENLRKSESILIFLSFFIKISYQSKESPLSKQSPL